MGLKPLFHQKTLAVSIIIYNFAFKLKLLIIMAKLNRLKIVLAEQEKTAKWLSEQIGKSNCTVSKWCNNKTQPDLQTIDMISKVLGIDKRDLLTP